MSLNTDKLNALQRPAQVRWSAWLGDGPRCSFCGAKPHKMGECPACGSREDAETEIKRLNNELRAMAKELEVTTSAFRHALQDMADAQAALGRIADILPWDSYAAKMMLDIAEAAIKSPNDGTQRRLPPPAGNDNTKNENGGSRSLE